MKSTYHPPDLFFYPLTLLILLFIFSGCNPVTHTPDQSVEAVGFSTATDTPQVPTPSFTASATVTPSHTPTPIPTLPAKEAKLLLLDLLQNNGGCQLPCLWGLTPGETDVQALDLFMEKFGNEISSDTQIRHDKFNESGVLDLISWIDDLRITVGLSYQSGNGKLERFLVFANSAREYQKDQGLESVDVFGDLHFYQSLHYFMLPQILSKYGRPSKVLIAPFVDDPDYPPAAWMPFSIVLYYPDLGVLVEYITPKERVDDHYRGCPMIGHINLVLWSPKQEISITEVVQRKSGNGINSLNVDFFKPIEEATSLTLDEFYQAFKDPNNSQCIETPMDIWPKP